MGAGRTVASATGTAGHPGFDGGDRPERGEILDCVHCGLCLPTCPTYLMTGLETASPRGRVYLIRSVEEGQGGISPVFVKHLDQCLGCLACQTACPSGVPYANLIEAARDQVERQYERPVADRVWRRLLLHLFPYPRRMRPLIGALYWYQRAGLSRLVRATRLLERLSPRLARLERLLPPVPSARARRPLPERTPAKGTRRGRVGLLTGCVQPFVLPEITRATVRVLASAGYEVITPRGQGCCGAMHLHTGHLDAGRDMARRLIAAFAQAGVDLVVADAAGCGAALKGYGHLLRDDPAWRERAAAFSERVRDVSELLGAVTWDGALRELPLTVTYHEACHLAHGQRIRQEPRNLLRRVPGLRLVELAESDLCCGSAGVYNLLEPEMSRDLLRRKVERIQDTGAAVVAMGNIGCLLQIRLGLEQAGLPVRAVHVVEVLDWALHGGAERHGPPAGAGRADERGTRATYLNNQQTEE
jgi:glycolate oxidase iron-sulfur subunit